MNTILINRRELKLFGTLFLILLTLLIVSRVIESRVKRGNLSAPLKVAVLPFGNVTLTAKAAYVYDTRTKTVLYAKNENVRLPLASLTKVMTALVATEVAPALSQVIVDNDALMPEGDSGLHVGEKWSLKDLIDFSLTSSSNDGIHAVALALGALDRAGTTPKERESDFVNLMNKKASEIDMKNTYYFNDTGLDETDIKGGAYGSAKDMATLFDYVLTHHPDLFEATTERSVSFSSDQATYTARNTDIIINQIPGIKASKTGFTSIAGGNLVIAFDPELGRPIIISVLGSTESERFEDIKKLVDATLKAITVDSH